MGTPTREGPGPANLQTYADDVLTRARERGVFRPPPAPARGPQPAEGPLPDPADPMEGASLVGWKPAPHALWVLVASVRVPSGGGRGKTRLRAADLAVLGVLLSVAGWGTGNPYLAKIGYRSVSHRLKGQIPPTTAQRCLVRLQRAGLVRHHAHADRKRTVWDLAPLWGQLEKLVPGTITGLGHGPGRTRSK